MNPEKQSTGDTFTCSGGNQNIAKDHGTAVQHNTALSAPVPVEQLLTLLQQARQNLNDLPLPATVKEEVLLNIRSAEILAEKPQPEAKKIASRLKDATSALQESSKTVAATITLGNLLGQGLVWCGEQWVKLGA